MVAAKPRPRPQPEWMKIDGREREVLASLYAIRDEWVRPMHIGGRDGSHHSQTLRLLARRGLVERRKHCRVFGHETKGWCRCKGSCTYRITAAGCQVVRAEVRYVG